ncbi:MAG: hypothetical protein HFI68_06100 [Lachnospiraceae bacterium]|nr:hypothetical protein [Lachnospiraceae bacterium]
MEEPELLEIAGSFCSYLFRFSDKTRIGKSTDKVMESTDKAWESTEKHEKVRINRLVIVKR